MVGDHLDQREVGDGSNLLAKGHLHENLAILQSTQGSHDEGLSTQGGHEFSVQLETWWVPWQTLARPKSYRQCLVQNVA